MDWFVVRTKARQELRAIHHLEEQGFKVYCPQIPKYNGLKEVVGRQVLFPGYCFRSKRRAVNCEHSVNAWGDWPGVFQLWKVSPQH